MSSSWMVMYHPSPNNCKLNPTCYIYLWLSTIRNWTGIFGENVEFLNVCHTLHLLSFYMVAIVSNRLFWSTAGNNCTTLTSKAWILFAAYLWCMVLSYPSCRQNVNTGTFKNMFHKFSSTINLKRGFPFC